MMTITTLVSIGLIAGALGAVATGMARRVALRAGWVVVTGSGEGRGRPVPLLGGVAICGACMLSFIGVGGRFYTQQIVLVLVGGLLMAGLGLWDDRRPLSPLVKFFGQLVVASGLVLAGFRAHLPFPDWVNAVITLAWVLYLTNALNLLDNMDGLAGGVGAIAGFCFATMAFLGANEAAAGLAVALTGAALGFLYFNVAPARIYMGDAGSLFLGFVLAGLGVLSMSPGGAADGAWIVPVLVLAVPIADTTFVTLARSSRGVPFWQGGRDHLSHRLVARGWSVRHAVGVLYVAAAVAGGLGVGVWLLGR